MPVGQNASNKTLGVVTRMTSPSRDKAELRAAMQDSVMEFTRLRRERLLPDLRAAHPHATPEELKAKLDEMQPLFHEYDPVIELAIMGADYRNSPELRRQANSEAAQYVRPKLKSVEFTVDPNSATELEARRALAGRLVGLLDAAAAAKRDTIVEVEANSVTVTTEDADQAGE